MSATTKQLESTTNYDERRKIRARIRQVMADNEGICHQITMNRFRRRQNSHEYQLRLDFSHLI
jgi:hypothetical protein